MHSVAIDTILLIVAHLRNRRPPESTMDMDTANRIQTLPPEILEDVLRQIPLLDLVRSQRVCRQWTAVVRSSAKLQRAMYQTAKPQRCVDCLAPSEEASLNSLLSASQSKPISRPSGYAYVDDFPDGGDSVANCLRGAPVQYPDYLSGLVASGCSIHTMGIPHFRQRLDETALCSLTSLVPPPSWMTMHIFRRECPRLSITFQSLSNPGELKCITVENSKGVRLGDVMRSVFIDHVQ